MGVQVEGNYIGTDTTGTAAIGNGTTGSGITLNDASNNTIGGSVKLGRGDPRQSPVMGVMESTSSTEGHPAISVEGNDIGIGQKACTLCHWAITSGIYILDFGNGNTIGGVYVRPGDGSRQL